MRAQDPFTILRVRLNLCQIELLASPLPEPEREALQIAWDTLEHAYNYLIGEQLFGELRSVVVSDYLADTCPEPAQDKHQRA
jgi:hypothetical protein